MVGKPGTVIHELDCGCGCHLEGNDEQGLIIKIFLHLEAAHPEIEEPTIELAEGMAGTKAYGKEEAKGARRDTPRVFAPSLAGAPTR